MAKWASRITACVTIAILVVLTAYTIFAPSYSSTNLASKTTEEQKGDLLITSTAYVSPSGQPVLASDKGYATIIKTSRDGKTILEEYLDENGNPAVLSAGYSSIKREYTDGLNTRIIYLDSEKQPVVISSGYDTIRRTYNDARLSDTDTYWIGDEQVERKQGYWSLKRLYGTGKDRKRVIRQEYRDQNELLTSNSSGYAYWERAFNEQGKVAIQKYYGADGKPASISFGYYGYQREYDGEGRTTRIIYLGEDGQPANTSRGYAIEKTVYDEAGAKTFYYDANGEPVTAGKNQFGVLKTDDGNTYLNEDGEMLFRLDNILQTYPVLVLVCGSLVLVIALCAKGKLQSVFIAVYFCFIIYMTMAWRETGTSRARFELFWSYRQFLTNKKLRLEILNNIWLFVPFGIAVRIFIQERTPTKSFLWTVLISILFSAGIESVQLAARIGLCEVDDVISNSLGAVVGAILANSFQGREPSSIL
ncbi:MAG: VanZ family protein [Clostridia bacterium]|nr:VanZ family protein [Clostridia bacterium]